MKNTPSDSPVIFRGRFNLIPDYAKTLILFLLATATAAIINNFAHSQENVAVVYVLAVVIVSSLTTGYRWSVITAVAGVLGINFFFTEPYFQFNMHLVGYPLTFMSMLAVALITSTLTTRIKTQVRLSIGREARTQLLYEITKKLLITRGLESIVELTSSYITSLFGCDVDFYVDDFDDDLGDTLIPVGNAPALSKEDFEAARLTFVNQVASGAGAGTHTNATRFYMPIVSQGQSYGVIGLSHADSTTFAEGDMTFLDMIVSQAAMAMERQRLSDDQRKILIEAEKEKMRSNLLRAISHDLRTPLTGILGSSSAILENSSKLTPEVHDKLVSDIREDSQWLIRMVENLLSVTRMKEGETSVTKAPEAVEEIVAEAISRIRMRFSGRKINVRVPDDLMMVPMDGTLIEQVIINLVENAVKHSKSETPIDVNVRKEHDCAVFEILDGGEGIPEADLPYLFDGYASRQNVSSDSSRGMGIGLSICNSIVNAHGGKITAENRPEGGAKFTFDLPM